jgi:hypothetical protein
MIYFSNDGHFEFFFTTLKLSNGTFLGIFRHFVEIFSATFIQVTKDYIDTYILVQSYLLFPYYVMRWPSVLSDI